MQDIQQGNAVEAESERIRIEELRRQEELTAARVDEERAREAAMRPRTPEEESGAIVDILV